MIEIEWNAQMRPCPICRVDWGRPLAKLLVGNGSRWACDNCGGWNFLWVFRPQKRREVR